MQVHAESPVYDPAAFRPWRLMALAFKALKSMYRDYELWRDFPYEYETRLAIDVINGGPAPREWVEDRGATAADLDALAALDEKAWRDEREPVLMYR